MTQTAQTAQKNKQLAIRLAGVALAFSVLGFAMVPLYDVICRVTGINGKTNAEAVAMPANTQVDTSRWITVQFLSHAMPGSGLVFKPEQFSMKVHPGELTTVMYEVVNTQKREMNAQAIPSYAPQSATPYFLKVECFCFKQQTLKANEARQMPVSFYISSALPKNVKTITLSYTFFEVGLQGKTN